MDTIYVVVDEDDRVVGMDPSRFSIMKKFLKAGVRCRTTQDVDWVLDRHRVIRCSREVAERKYGWPKAFTLEEVNKAGVWEGWELTPAGNIRSTRSPLLQDADVEGHVRRLAKRCSVLHRRVLQLAEELKAGCRCGDGVTCKAGWVLAD